MPELPEVETIRRSLELDLLGKTVVKATVTRFKTIKSPDNINDFCKNIVGLKFEKLSRRGKYLIAEMSQGYSLIVHLGMTGALFHIYTYKDLPDKYMGHIEGLLTLDDNCFLAFCDIRKFGSMRLLDSIQMQNFKPFTSMGPEPELGLHPFSMFYQNLAKVKYRKKTIKELLLDQTVIAGVGNIYACEALYRAKIKPDRLVEDVDLNEALKLYDLVCLILAQSIDEGGSSISDYVDSNGKKGNFQNFHKVYNKKTCPLGHEIKNVKIEGRSSFYCDTCQK